MALLHVFVAILIWILFYNFYWKRRKFPPGPTPLPILGNIQPMKRIRNGHEVFIQWQKKYGPIFTFWISEIPVITICDYQLMQETFVKDADSYTGKFTVPKMDNFFRGGTFGVVFTEGELWRDQRRFALSVLRNFGMGRNLMEQKILDEIIAFTETLSEDVNESSYLKEKN
uniref:Cytochrome P450 n=1 Tax=Panagrolaimus superbus TaxID=310955 RepID=A0A914Z9Q4_9BILA